MFIYSVSLCVYLSVCPRLCTRISIKLTCVNDACSELHVKSVALEVHLQGHSKGFHINMVYDGKLSAVYFYDIKLCIEM